MAFGADKYKSIQTEKEKLLSGNQVDDDSQPVIEYSAIEIYRTLIKEKDNGHVEDRLKSEKMKSFLKETMKTDKIEQVKLEDLKKAVEGDNMLSRIKYRKQVGSMMSGKRPNIAKGQILKEEHAHAEHIDEKLKNDNFGFKCLHYSISEASGSLRIVVLNKAGGACRVRVVTEDAEAKAIKDFEPIDKILEFKSGESTGVVEVVIKDDDNWEPDRDFFVQLMDANTQQPLTGQDVRTRITIIDDDQPGQIAFEESKAIKALASEEFAEIVIIRKNGSDGVVTVDYETQELGKSEHTATPNVDYEPVKGTLKFEAGETTQTIKVPIIPHKDTNDIRDESFGILLSNITPSPGAKLSKKSFQIVNIVTDVESKKKSEAL